jgi:hypothetical protein
VTAPPAAPPAVSSAAERYALGLAASRDNHPEAAARHLRAALRQLSEPGDAELRARILISLAWADAERGHIDSGFALLNEAQRLVPPSLTGLLFGQRGLLLRRTGRDEAALAQYDAAVAALDGQALAEDLAKVLSNRALVHLAAARVAPARADLSRSVWIADRVGLPLPAAVARHNLADLDLLRGDIPAALHGYAKAERVYVALAPGKLATLGGDRARALLAAGLFGEADRQLAAALRQAREQRLTHVYARVLLLRAEAALLAGQPAAAVRWADRARARFLARANHRQAALASLIALRARQASARPQPGLAEQARTLAAALHELGLAEDARVAWLVTARALAARGAPDEARQALRRSGRPRGTDRLDTRMLYRLAQAELARTAGDEAGADRALRAGMATLHRYRARLGCLDLQTGAAVHGRDLARAGLAAALAEGSPAAVFRWSERSRAQALLLTPARPPEDPAAGAALEQLRQVRLATRAAELAGRPSGRLRRIEARLRDQIRQDAWTVSGQPGQPGPAASPVSLGPLRAELGPAAMIIYLRDGAALYALAVTRQSARIVRLGRYARIEEALLRVRADLDAEAGRALPPRLAATVAAATARDSAQLAAMLLDPVADLAGDRELIIVPTGLLVTVPWALFAGDSRPVTVAPSATFWLDTRHRRDTARRGDGVTVALAAGPGTQRGETEIAEIARLHPGAAALPVGAATPAATLAAMDGTSVVHLAAHGTHQPDNALFSALELSGGPLMGYDLQRLKAAPALVVLSCCDLGLADVRPGDEMLGMVSALLHTGTRTVVASVTQVADDTAMRVMAGLHAALRQGLPPAQALAQATRHEPCGFVCFGAG